MKYGWTFDQIASMTPFQQYEAYLSVKDGDGVMTFDSTEEAEAYMGRKRMNHFLQGELPNV